MADESPGVQAERSPRRFSQTPWSGSISMHGCHAVRRGRSNMRRPCDVRARAAGAPEGAWRQMGERLKRVSGCPRFTTRSQADSPAAPRLQLRERLVESAHTQPAAAQPERVADGALAYDRGPLDRAVEMTESQFGNRASEQLYRRSQAEQNARSRTRPNFNESGSADRFGARTRQQYSASRGWRVHAAEEVGIDGQCAGVGRYSAVWP